MTNRQFPKYPNDTDYTTNSPSYYDDLAKKQHLIKLLAERIWEYEKTLDESLEHLEQRLTDYIFENDALMTERLENWDQRIDEMPEEMRSLFIAWLEDGTLAKIINHDVLGNKADKSFVDSEIEQLDDNIKESLAKILISKRDKDTEIEMKDLSQQVKESMTGGGVAVVGENAVGTVNIKDGSVTSDKLADQINLHNYFTYELWSGSREYGNDSVTLYGDGTQTRYVSHRASGTNFVGGKKFYIQLKATAVGNPARISFNLFNEDDDSQILYNNSFDYVRNEHIETVVELPEATSEGRLRLQLTIDYKTPDQSADSFVVFENAIVMDITHLNFNTESLLNAFSGLPHFEGSYPLSETYRLSQINDEIEFPLTLPVRKYSDIEQEKVVLRYDTTVSFYKREGNNMMDHATFFEGHQTLQLNPSDRGWSQIIFPVERISLQDYQYIDVHFKVDEESRHSIRNGQIDLMSSTSLENKMSYFGLGSDYNLTKNHGWQVVRIHKDDLSNEMDPNGYITHIRVLFMAREGEDIKINLGKVSFVKVKRGAVSIHFDDAYRSQYDNGFRIAEKYDLTGSVGVITDWVKNRDTAMNWSDLREMNRAGWVIASHTHTHPHLRDVSDGARVMELGRSHEILKRQGFTFGSRCFITPFGSYNADVDDIARKYYAIVRTMSHSDRDKPLNVYPQKNPRDQHYISPYITDTFDTFKKWIDEAISTKREVSLAFHRISETSDSKWNVYPEIFEQVCKYIDEKRSEGVLDVVDWRDTLTKSEMSAVADREGLVYSIYNDDKPALLKLPVD